MGKWSKLLTTSQKLQRASGDRSPLLSAPNRATVEASAIGSDTANTGTRLGRKEKGQYSRFWKRLIDVVVASVGLLVLSPLLIITGVLIKCTSRGPVLYWQDRVGRGGRHFRIAKFRSMIVDADKIGPEITASGDARVTSFGARLRKTKIDEILQLWNVLKGEMSLVGPRPELPRYVADYTQEQQRVLCVCPGITDPASIRYRHEEEVLAQSGNPEEFYRNVVLPHKLDLNLDYIEKMSFLFDTKLILQTIKFLFV
jgi:lipopolysaccharide/colanic/teichoic acid biosynthesis glycosyltransferase